MNRRAVALGAVLLVTAAAHGASEPRPLRGLRAEVSALLLQGVPGGGLPVALASFPAASAGGELLEVPFLLEIALADSEAGSLELYVYAVDAAGQVAAHLAVGVEPEPGGDLRWAAALELPAGSYSLRALAFDPAGRRYGLAVEQVEPPHTAAGGTPRLADGCQAWRAAGDLELAASAGARPVLVAGERRRLELPPPAGALAVVLAPLGEDGVAGPPVGEAPLVAGESGLEFEVPRLPQGRYRLSVSAAGGRSRGVEIWLVSAPPPDAADCGTSWPRLLRLATATAPPPPAPPPVAASREISERYLRVLLALAEGAELGEVARRLAAMEAPLVERDALELERLYASEERVVRRLAQLEPAGLIPVVALHGRAYAEHYAAGRFPLASHSRRLAAAAAAAAADALPSPDDRRLTAAAMCGLAETVERHRMSLAAQELLERALELAPDLEPARLLLAISYERTARFEDAEHHLRLLLSANSANVEARLRLAVLALRAGQHATAERDARTVVSERVPDWQLSLAYQVLARALAAGGRYPELVRELRPAVRRLPADPVLTLLLAYALDRTGAKHEAERLRRGLPVGGGLAGRTPRFRYADPAAIDLGALEETVRQSVTVRLPLLAAALRRGDGEGSAP